MDADLKVRTTSRAFVMLIPTPCRAAQFSLTGIVLDAGAHDPQRRPSTSSSRDSLATCRIRSGWHLILRTPEYQLA
jgi:hypothetical protein